MIKVEVETAKLTQALDAAIKRAGNINPLLEDIGEHLIETTKQRFETSTGPDGQAWLPNSEATYLSYLSAFKKSFKKNGEISKAGERRKAGKKPLIGEGRYLSTQFGYDVIGNTLEWGSPAAYSAIHQYGGMAGRNRLVNIPARPFLGISPDDEDAIVEKAARYLDYLL